MADAQLAAFQGQTRGDTYFLRLVGELRVGVGLVFHVVVVLVVVCLAD